MVDILYPGLGEHRRYFPYRVRPATVAGDKHIQRKKGRKLWAFIASQSSFQ